MPTHQKISVTVPAEVAHELVAEMQRTAKPKSQVVTRCLRAGLGMELERGIHEFTPNVVDAPSQEDLRLRAMVAVGELRAENEDSVGRLHRPVRSSIDPRSAGCRNSSGWLRAPGRCELDPARRKPLLASAFPSRWAGTSGGRRGRGDRAAGRSVPPSVTDRVLAHNTAPPAWRRCAHIEGLRSLWQHTLSLPLSGPALERLGRSLSRPEWRVAFRAVAGQVEAKGQIKEASIEAVVIRADGTVEDLGVIAHTDPEKVDDRRERDENEES
jgi:hypothetical protein